MTRAAEIFLELIKTDTTSDEASTSYPSAASQLDFADMLAKRLQTIGLSDAKRDSFGYVTASIPSNIKASVPVIAFIAHMDTSPDASGKNIHPIITENYDGGEILQKDGVISPDHFPVLLNYKGDNIISSDGTTLLGADDKAGIAEILAFAEYMMENPLVPHGEIKIAFTPDEEIGRGVDNFNVKDFGADFAFTIDGGEVGEFEYENFNAARAVINIEGKSVHPGYAKDIMVNAALAAAEFAGMLPVDETPARTSGRVGFFHLVAIEGRVGGAKLTYIIRDFDNDSFEQRKRLISELARKASKKFGCNVVCDIHDEYKNMISCFNERENIIELAAAAYKKAGVPLKTKPIRGGTDGARLSFMGLPCPNIFAGGHNFHGPYEFIPESSMSKAVEVIKNIALLAPEFFK